MSSGPTFGCYCFYMTRLCRGQMQPYWCNASPTKQWVPHASVYVITCTQRNQALLWTSPPQTHRWCCYYSSLLEFSGKEGLALWHTSCPLKSPTERGLSRPSFQTPALMVAWKETSGGKPELNLMDFHFHVCNQCTHQIFTAIVIFCGTCHLISALCLQLKNVLNVQKLNSVGTCQIDVGIYKPGLTPILVVSWSSIHQRNILSSIMGSIQFHPLHIQGDLMVSQFLCPCNNVWA